MTSIKAIANKTSIMFKIDMGFLNTSEIVFRQGNTTYNGVTHFAGWYYVLPDGSELEGIREFGIQYYTADSSNITEIPFDNALFKYNDSKAHYSGEAYIFPTKCTAMEDGSHTVYLKVRDTTNHPLICLLKGLTEDTDYHIGYYYKDENNNKTSSAYTSVHTKPLESGGLIFNTPTISSGIPEAYSSNATTLSTTLSDILDSVTDMFNDTTDIDYTYSPTIVYSAKNFAANNAMEFNCSHISTNLRTIVIHELEHNHFDPKDINSGEFCSNSDVVSFMEFATDCEGSTWGRIQNHFYPIISSETYDYIDDYLVCMATDVGYLFGTT